MSGTAALVPVTAAALVPAGFPGTEDRRANVAVPQAFGWRYTATKQDDEVLAS